MYIVSYINVTGLYASSFAFTVAPKWNAAFSDRYRNSTARGAVTECDKCRNCRLTLLTLMWAMAPTESPICARQQFQCPRQASVVDTTIICQFVRRRNMAGVSHKGAYRGMYTTRPWLCRQVRLNDCGGRCSCNWWWWLSCGWHGNVSDFGYKCHALSHDTAVRFTLTITKTKMKQNLFCQNEILWRYRRLTS